MLNKIHKNIHISSKALATIFAFVCTFFLTYALSVFAQEPPAIVSGVTDNGGLIGEFFGNLAYPIALGIGGLFVGIGGFALDLTIHHLIIGMGGIWNSPFGIGMVEVWKVVRDIFNILFIFSFVFIGIKTILSSDDSSTKRSLVHLIIAAIFINFSLLITQVIIDFSNVAATQIYTMTVAGIENPQVGKAVTGSPSLTLAFMDTVKLGSFFDAKPAGITGVQLFIYSILMMIFFIIAGIIFMFATYHIIYRFVALMIYMIVSPILFLGFILPNFQSYTDKWLGGLLRQSFFAPAFLFLMYLSLLAISKLKILFGTQGGENGFPSILEGKDMATTSFTIFVFFAIGIGFLYAAVKVGDQMGIAGSKSALGAINKARGIGQKMIGGATFGFAAGMGRGIFGQMAHRMSESDKLKDAASQRGLAGMAARMQLRGARVVGNASFDGRKVGGLGKNLGIGEGRKGGFKSHTDEIEKKEKEFAKSLGEVDDDDNVVSRLLAEKELEEQNLKEGKKKRAEAKTSEEKADAAKKIFEAEEALKKIEENIKREKSRRQIGTEADVANNNQLKEEKRVLDLEEGSFKAKWNAAQTKEEREALIEQKKELNKRRKELTKKMRSEWKTLGYAGVLEKRNFFTSLAFGRATYQDHEAGSAIRKQYMKAAKKSKQDQDADALRETVEKAAKKE